MPITRFRIFSDLHLEFSDWTPPPAAGGVPGNHELYGAELPDALHALRAQAQRYDVTEPFVGPTVGVIELGQT